LQRSGQFSRQVTRHASGCPRAPARLQSHGCDAAAAYTTPEGHLPSPLGACRAGQRQRRALGARFKVGTAQTTQVRLASLLPSSDSDNDPVSLVTLRRVAAGRCGS
jgi:hypothetical protein